MDFNGAKTLLQTTFATAWGSTSPIVEMNEFYVSSTRTAYVGHDFLETNAFEPQIGRKFGTVGQTRIRHYGIWTVKIMTLLGSGIDSTYSAKVKEYCECKRISGILTYAAKLTYSGKSLNKAFYEEQYAIEFQFDEYVEIGTPVASGATNITNNSFTANWNLVSTATGYKIDVATDLNFNNPLSNYYDLDVGNVLSYNITGLTASTCYFYRIRYYGDSCINNVNSNIIHVFVFNSTMIPVATDATSITSTGFTANWETVSGATGYKIDVSTDIDFTTFVAGYEDYDAGLVLTLPITGLAENTCYFYRVRAYNATFTSMNSNEIHVPQESVEVLTTVTITDKVVCSAVPGATGYRIDVSEYQDFSVLWPGYDNVFSADGTLGLEIPLTNTETNYAWIRPIVGYPILYVRARWENGDYTSGNSRTVTYVRYIDPESLRVADITTTSVKLLFDEYIGTETRYYQIATDIAFNNIVIDAYTTNGYPVVSGLTPDTCYYVRYRTKIDGVYVKEYYSAGCHFRTLALPASPPFALISPNGGEQFKNMSTLMPPQITMLPVKWSHGSYTGDLVIQLKNGTSVIAIATVNVTADAASLAIPFLTSSTAYYVYIYLQANPSINDTSADVFSIIT